MSGNVLVNTVEDKRSNYTERNYSRAMLARKVHNWIGRPSIWDYLKIIEGNLFHNCPVTLLEGGPITTIVVAIPDNYCHLIDYFKEVR